MDIISFPLFLVKSESAVYGCERTIQLRDMPFNNRILCRNVTRFRSKYENRFVNL